MNINSGAFWEGLGYEERRIAVQAIAEWQEKEKIEKGFAEFRKAKLDKMYEEILDKIAEFNDMVTWQEMNELMTELNYTYN